MKTVPDKRKPRIPSKSLFFFLNISKSRFYRNSLDNCFMSHENCFYVAQKLSKGVYFLSTLLFFSRNLSNNIFSVEIFFARNMSKLFIFRKYLETFFSLDKCFFPFEVSRIVFFLSLESVSVYKVRFSYRAVFLCFIWFITGIIT